MFLNIFRNGDLKAILYVIGSVPPLHWDLSKEQEGVQDNVPLLYPRDSQVCPFKLEPSHSSPQFIILSPQWVQELQ